MYLYNADGFQMLNCIIGMVDKTKRALAVLQERSLRDREELSLWMRRHAEGMDSDMKKRSNDMMAHTIRQTEDRVSEVRRRAGESSVDGSPGCKSNQANFTTTYCKRGYFCWGKNFAKMLARHFIWR